MSTGAETAQDAYRRMMKDQVAPALRSIGFKGSGGKFHIALGDYLAHVEAQKSVHNSTSHVEFTWNLDVWHLPSPEPRGVWSDRLGAPMPTRYDKWWRVDEGISPDEVAQAVVEALEALRLASH